MPYIDGRYNLKCPKCRNILRYMYTDWEDDDEDEYLWCKNCEKMYMESDFLPFVTCPLCGKNLEFIDEEFWACWTCKRLFDIGDVGKMVNEKNKESEQL